MQKINKNIAGSRVCQLFSIFFPLLLNKFFPQPAVRILRKYFGSKLRYRIMNAKAFKQNRLCIKVEKKLAATSFLYATLDISINLLQKIIILN